MEYKKQTLTELQKVGSESLDKNEQHYKITYLEKTKKFMDKVRVYFFDRQPDKCTPRSITFLNPEELKNFIQECSNALLFLKEQRVKPELVMPLSVYRKEVMLPDLLKEIREGQIKRWGNGDN